MYKEQPSWYLLFQSQQLKHQNKVWNLFKVDEKYKNKKFVVFLLLTLK